MDEDCVQRPRPHSRRTFKPIMKSPAKAALINALGSVDQHERVVGM